MTDHKPKDVDQSMKEWIKARQAKKIRKPKKESFEEILYLGPKDLG